MIVTITVVKIVVTVIAKLEQKKLLVKEMEQKLSSLHLLSSMKTREIEMLETRSCCMR